MRAARDKQRDSNASAVNHIRLIYRYVIHVVSPYVLNSMKNLIDLAWIEVFVSC